VSKFQGISAPNLKRGKGDRGAMLESELGKQNPEPDGCAGSRKQRLEWQKVELGSGWCGHYDLLLTALVGHVLPYYRLKNCYSSRDVSTHKTQED
jgi:hypothetical protein